VLLVASVALVGAAGAGARGFGAGDLDTTFGTGGSTTVDFRTPASGTTDDAGNDLVQAFGRFGVAGLLRQPDDRIVLAGSGCFRCSRTFTRHLFVLARYTADGLPDRTFGHPASNGILYTGFGADVGAHARDIAVEGNGKIVVAGNASTTNPEDSSSRIAVARYPPGGALDTTSGGDGRIVTDLGTGMEAETEAVLVQPSGKILVAGSARVSTDSGMRRRLLLVRYRTNGGLDSGFGNGGKLLVSSGPWNLRANDAVLQPDGKIVVAGAASRPDGPPGGILTRLALWRFLSDGSRDEAFGSFGRVLRPGPSTSASAVLLQGDGRIVATGSLDQADHPLAFDLDVLVTRYRG
jgi:uncharacterized delta-60 repeat protein